MDIFFLLKVASIGLIVAVLYQILSKAGRDEYALLTALTGIAVVLAMLLPKLNELLNSVESIFDL